MASGKLLSVWKRDLHGGVGGGVVPDFCAVVFFGLPVLVVEIEEVSGFEDFFVGHLGTEVGIHAVEGDIFIPVVDFGVELHTVGGGYDFGA